MKNNIFWLDLIQAIVNGENKGKIRLGAHSKDSLRERGYYPGDIISCIRTGLVTEVNNGYNSRLKKWCTNITIEGKDRDHNPGVVVFSVEKTGICPIFSVITIFPPTDKGRFMEVI